MMVHGVDLEMATVGLAIGTAMVAGPDVDGLQATTTVMATVTTIMAGATAMETQTLALHNSTSQLVNWTDTTGSSQSMPF